MPVSTTLFASSEASVLISNLEDLEKDQAPVPLRKACSASRMKLDRILGRVDLVFPQLWLKMVPISTRLHLEWLKFAEMPPSRG